MKKFDKVFKSIIKEDSDKQYVFDDIQFDMAWKQTWNDYQRKMIQGLFKKGAMPVGRIKSIFKELCKAVSEGNYSQAYQLWRKVGTDGYLFRLMWAQGWDCKVPKIVSSTGTIKFVPHVASEAVIKEELSQDQAVYKIIENYVYDLDLSDYEDFLEQFDSIDDMIHEIFEYVADEGFESSDDIEALTDEWINDNINQYREMGDGWDDQQQENQDFQDANDYQSVNKPISKRRVIKEDANLAPHIRKMQGYYKKDSDPKRLIKSIDNPDKLINRWLAAIKIGWQYAAEEFEKAIRERGLLTDEEIAEKKSQYTLDDSVKVPERTKEESYNLQGFVRPVFLAMQEIAEERNYKFEIKCVHNALTDTGKEYMSRNGRAWTIGYKMNVISKGGQGREVVYDFDIVTNEGIDSPIYGYVWGMNQKWKATSLRQFKLDMCRSFDRDLEHKLYSNY